MGKSKRQRAKARRKNKQKPLPESQLALVQQLDSGSAEERLQACLTLSNLFDEQANDSLLQLLLRNGATKVFVKRLVDPNPQVKLHALGALCNMLARYPTVLSDRYVQDDIPQAALAVIRSPPSTTDAETKELALFLLCELFRLDCNAIHVFNHDPSAFLALCQMSPTHESVARLIHTALDGNVGLACAVAQKMPDAMTALRSGCSSSDGVIGLHCLGALLNIAMLASPPALDKDWLMGTVFDRTLQMLNSNSSSSSGGGGGGDIVQGKQLCLEILTNSCSFPQEEEQDCLDQEKIAQWVQVVSGAIIAKLAPLLGNILKECEADTRSELSMALGSRTTGLVDNLVQNASDAHVNQLGLQNVFDCSIRLLSGFLAKEQQCEKDDDEEVEEEEEDDKKDETEEFLQATSALCWSVARRAQQGLQLRITNEHVHGLLTPLNQSSSTQARMSLLGAIGTLACVGVVEMEQAGLHNCIRALVAHTNDVSLAVAMQAVDSLIDVFAQEPRDELYEQLRVSSCLHANVRRFKSTLGGASNSNVIDVAALTDVTSNLEAFLEYKNQQQRATM